MDLTHIRTERSQHESPTVWSFVPFGFQLLFYFGALVWLVMLSFSEVERIDQPRWQPTLKNYSEVISDSLSRAAILRTLGFALLNTVIALTIAIPAACVLLIGCPRRWAAVLMYVLFVPFFTNYFIRMVGWQAWLSSIDLLYTMAGAVVGLQSILIPLATLFLFIAGDQLDDDVLAAAINLGASSPQIITRVIIPAMKPAIVGGSFSCFILSLSDFVCVRFLAGNRYYTASSLLAERIQIQDWGSAFALACAVLFVAIGTLSLTGAIMSRSIRE